MDSDELLSRPPPFSAAKPDARAGTGIYCTMVVSVITKHWSWLVTAQFYVATMIIMHASHSLPFPSQYFLVIQLTRSRQLAIVIDTQHSISLTSVQASFENLRTNMQHC